MQLERNVLSISSVATLVAFTGSSLYSMSSMVGYWKFALAGSTMDRRNGKQPGSVDSRLTCGGGMSPRKGWNEGK